MLDLDDPNQGAKPQVALARKWRPHRFAEVVGQEHAVRTLRNALASGRLHHAYMFTGTRGVGKTTLARILAKSFNCREMKDGEPCCQCDACRGVDMGNHPDVIEMDAASTTQVDNMRELLDSAQYAPSSSTYKVYIIDEVHMLSRHSFNAMLKTLEEPPEHIKFILATTDPQQVPATVQSRCLRFSLRRLPVAKIAGHLATVLKEEGIDFEEGALSMIAAQSDGSVRDALSVLEEVIAAEGKVQAGPVREMLGLVGIETAPKVLGLVIAGDAKGALALADEMHAKGVNFDTVLNGMVEQVHHAQLAQHSHGLKAEVAGELRDLDTVKSQLVYEIATQTLARLPAAPDPKVAFDMALLRMLPLFELAAKTEVAKKPGKNTQPADADAKANAKAAAKEKATEKKSDLNEKGPASAEGQGHNWARENAIDHLPADIREWDALCAKLDAQARALGQKCSLVGSEETTIRLAITPGDKGLLDYRENMRSQISEHLGIEVKVEIVESEKLEATPADIKVERDEKMLKEAVESAEGSAEMEKIRGAFPQSKVDEKAVVLKDAG